MNCAPSNVGRLPDLDGAHIIGLEAFPDGVVFREKGHHMVIQ